MTSFNDLIDHIRKGKVVLWVGSGLSSVAGYPSGRGLAKIIKSRVKPQDLIHFNEKFGLDDVSEEFVKLYSREELISILQDVFLKEPATTKYHLIIQKIPQISIIITTNYDTLFESVYGEELFPIILDTDIKNPDKSNKKNIYKIHGDINIPSSILITKEDYLNFYEEDKEKLLWTEVIHLVSNNAILFIGYSFEDGNIRYIFDKIVKRLGNNHGDIFFISPNTPPHKIRDLTKKYGIKYLDLPAEKAIPRIQKIIQKYLKEDMEKGYIGPDKFSGILESHKIHPRIELTSKKLRLKSLDTGDSKHKITGEFSLKINAEEKEKLEEFTDLISGKKFGKITLSKDFAEMRIDLSILGIDLLYPTQDLGEFTITSQPTEKTNSNFILKKSKYSISNLDLEIFKSAHTFCLKFYNEYFKIKIRPNVDQTLSFSLNIKHITDVAKCKEIYSFFSALFQGDTLIIFHKNYPKPFIIFNGKNVDVPEQKVKEIVYGSMFFNDIFQIQSEFGIQFDLSSKITMQDIENIRTVALLLYGKKVRIEKLSLQSIDITPKTKEEFLNDIIRNPHHIIEISGYTFTIQGQEIVIPKCIAHVFYPIIENFDKMEEQLNKGNIIENIVMRSKSDNAYISLRD